MTKAKVWRLVQLVCGLTVGFLLPRLQSPSFPPSPASPSIPLTLHIIQTSHPGESQARPRLPVYVGVMTARGYLLTRACSVWRTWGGQVLQLGGDIRFFVGRADQEDQEDQLERALEACPGLPVVVLDNVKDNAYPPQHKSFSMLAWMWDHYGNKSVWFMRADDDVYIKIEELLEFLRPINSSEPQYLGQAGRGRGLEKGQLDLAWNENFCMGGPSMVFSWVTLSLMRPNIDACYESMLSSHEDVEIGRCVTRSTGRVW